VSTGLKDKKILLGVCGSIAAYKSILLTRLLMKAGAQVKVVMTPSATAFVSPLNFSALTGNECLYEYTHSNGSNWNNHVHLALWADLMLIAPASASTISKMANGHCDNLLIGVYLSARCPVMIAPAMDEDMWKHGSTQNNLAKIQSFGNIMLPVGSGELASGLIGPGRMAEPEEIVAFIDKYFNPTPSKLKGKKILITAGPTFEHIDPVRFIGNHSSGKMGIELAQNAAMRGADVILILGPTDLMPNSDVKIKVIKVVSAEEMLNAALNAVDNADILIFAAAVADYAPVVQATEKIKKKDQEMTITLKKNPDIASTIGKIKGKNQISVGFALETNNELEHAKQKLVSKNFDLIVLNSLKEEGAGFRHDTNKITILDKEGNIFPFDLKSKQAVAVDILNLVESKICS
jgi:phosphopantothenoylcysteine decarboxylase/phosphopantothenate--cysteine ligase